MDTMKDTLELYYLTDLFSILADQKNFNALVQLFTEDIIFRGLENGKHISDMRGKDEIQKAFDSFANQFLVLYHMNGEKLFDIDGDHATGTTYCQVTLRFEKEQEIYQTQQAICYQNQYLKVNEIWKIKEMNSNIIWRETHEIIPES
jgi:ketosteroid isomerase-like protein